MSISASDVKTLRERTGAGIMDAKGALQEADGDFDRAVEILRVKGQASAAKRGGRAASQGIVSSYIHATGTIGVLVEVDCETDFVARNEQFQEFARDVALHVAAAPGVRYASEGKPENVQEKIVEGRLRKWLDDVVLLNQRHVNEDKHESKTLEQLRTELAASTGENVVIRRFARFQVGEE